MAMRSADAAAVGRASLILRRACRYFSDGKSGRVLNEEEKAAENIYIQKTEREKLEKLARKGYKPEEKPTSTPEVAEAAAKPSDPSATSSGVSSDKNRNYAVVAGVVAAAAALGWYLRSNTKKTEVQD